MEGGRFSLLWVRVSVTCWTGDDQMIDDDDVWWQAAEFGRIIPAVTFTVLLREQRLCVSGMLFVGGRAAIFSAARRHTVRASLL